MKLTDYSLILLNIGESGFFKPHVIRLPVEQDLELGDRIKKKELYTLRGNINRNHKIAT